MIAFSLIAFLPSITHPAERRAPLSALAAAHGVVLFAWLLLFLVQSRLIATHRVAIHRRLGEGDGHAILRDRGRGKRGYVKYGCQAAGTVAFVTTRSPFGRTGWRSSSWQPWNSAWRRSSGKRPVLRTFVVNAGNSRPRPNA